MKEQVKAEFKKMVKPFFSGRAYGGGGMAMWDLYEERASATSAINFGCDFNERGICKSRKSYPPGGGKRGCCGGCARSCAYHSEINKRWLPTFYKLWDDETGFWREGKGCILPRKMRSVVCLTTSCDIEARLVANTLMHKLGY